MGTKDKTEKLFVACRDVFAELVNGLIYQGDEVLREEGLLPGPTESIYGGAGTKLSSQFQDYSMYDIRGGSPRALYTLENQSGVDTRMPLRCAGYDGAAYRRQYKVGSGQRIYPVISAVLNWGEMPWNAATSVREMLGYPVPESAEDYLDRNRIHVFDMRFLAPAIRERFEGDARVVLDYLSDHGSMVRRRQKLRNPEEVMRMLHALSGDERYLEKIEFMKEEGGRCVCELLDSMVNKGMQEGLQKGLQQGLQEGKQQGLQEGKQQGLWQGISQGIRILITAYKELKVPYETAAAKVKEKYALDDAEVQRDMDLYW